MNNCRYISHTLLLLFFCLLFVPKAVSQSSGNKIAIKTEVHEVKVTADSLFVDTDIIVSNYKQSSSHEMTLTPVIYNKSNRLELPPVLISGKRRVKLDRRLLSLNLSPRVTESHVRQIANNSKGDYKINYQIAVPYKAWMQGADVIVLADNCGCGNVEDLITQTLVTNLPPPGYDYRPALAFIAPPKEEIKLRAESSAAYVTFETGKATLLPNFANNAAELDKIRKSVEYIKGESTAEIGSVSIIAYASPEGSESLNLNLSKRRAASLREYVRSVYNFQAAMMHSDGNGEDWDTLAKLIADDTSLEHKDQITRIISTVYPLDEREAQIKAIAGGSPYRYILDTYYPQLRRSDYRISYTVPSFSIEKGKEVFKTHPGMLSLEEMYHIAGTYERGSDEFKEIFDVAVRVFPNDRIANLNAATAALLKKDAESAKKYLKGLENDAAAWNSYGVLYTLLGEYEEAGEYLNKAVANGSAEARENLKQLEELKRVRRAITQ